MDKADPQRPSTLQNVRIGSKRSLGESSLRSFVLQVFACHGIKQVVEDFPFSLHVGNYKHCQSVHSSRNADPSK